MSTKRPRPEESENGEDNPTSPSTTHSDTTSTSRIYRRFQHIYPTCFKEFSREKFVSLCAYLCVLLRCGRRASISDLDSFFVRYSEYQVAYPALEVQQLLAPKVCIPSYHQWLDDNPILEEAAVSSYNYILNEPILRQIWAENQYTFLNIELRLKALANSSSRERATAPERE